MTHTHLLFTLRSLENLARNGRVSPAVAKIAGVLGIVVVGKASDEGTLQQMHKCRGEKRAIDTLFKEMKNTSGSKAAPKKPQAPDSWQDDTGDYTSQE